MGIFDLIIFIALTNLGNKHHHRETQLLIDGAGISDVTNEHCILCGTGFPQYLRFVSSKSEGSAETPVTGQCWLINLTIDVSKSSRMHQEGKENRQATTQLEDNTT